MSSTHTKFGWISSNGLEGDSITDGWRQLQYTLRFFLKKKGGYNKQNIKNVLGQWLIEDGPTYKRSALAFYPFGRSGALGAVNLKLFCNLFHHVNSYVLQGEKWI